MVETTRGETAAHERRYRKLLENIRDTVTVVDQNGAPIWTSASSRGDLGYESSFWVDTNLFDLVHPADRATIESSLGDVVAAPDAATDGEVRLRTPAGDYRHVGYRAVNKLADPDIAGIVITARPIDDEVRSRIERKHRQQELEDALAERAQFIADLSHEMRSPLHAIAGLAELVMSSEDLDPSLGRQVSSIGRESEALRVMLDGLLDFSKISANRLELRSEPLSPGAVVDAVAGAQTQAASAKGLEFTVKIDPALPLVVLGDDLRLRQVLINLVSNAIKYTDTGSVVLQADLAEDGLLEFSVVDTGPGIPEEAWSTLFEPYRQARDADAGKGTGLGLVITKRLVELMGGSLTFATGNDGTTFVATIPFDEARRGTDLESVVEPQDRTTNGCVLDVLVVDDSEVNLMLAQSQLERLGHQPTVVDNGMAAIEILGRQSFDLVLMDWHMPHMDGLETTRRIRSNEPPSTRIPIIATTASVMPGDKETCLAAGMDDYLAKPVSLADLEVMIGRWSDQTVDLDQPDAPGGVGIDRLLAELGDPTLVQSVVSAFIAEVPGWREALESGTSSGDFVTSRRAAHTLKSTALLLGATELSRLASDFDAADDPEELNRMLPALLRSLDETTEELHALGVNADVNKPEANADVRSHHHERKAP